MLKIPLILRGSVLFESILSVLRVIPHASGVNNPLDSLLFHMSIEHIYLANDLDPYAIRSR
jgi:hypothetical protein